MNKNPTILNLAQKVASEIVDGLNESVTPFHAVEYMTQKLREKGFLEIIEKNIWKLKKGGKYYFTRNQSCLVAFTVGKELNFYETCFKVVGCHTDSPSLRFVPNSYLEKDQYERVNINYLFL